MCPKSIFTVYGPSSMKFGMKVDCCTVKHDILATGKYSELVVLWQIACRIK